MTNHQIQSRSHRFRDTAVTTVFIFFGLALFVSALIIPKYNWDMIPYLALILDDGHMDETQLHEKTFSLVRESIPPEDWVRLTESSSYRKRQASDPAAFASMLPFYRVKIGYVYTLKLFGLIFDPIVSILVSSGLFASLSVISILAFLRSIKAAEASLVIIPVAILAGAFDVSRSSIPDSMFSFLIISSIYLCFSNKYLYSSMILALSTAIRPESIILIFSISACMMLARRQSYHYVFALVASVLVYSFISSHTEHPGWWTHFYFSNVEMQETMSDFKPNFDVFVYIAALTSGVAKALIFLNWPHLIMLLLIILVLGGYYNYWKSDGGLIISAIAMFIVIRIFIVPFPEERYYFPYTVLLYVSALSLYIIRRRESGVVRIGESLALDR